MPELRRAPTRAVRSRVFDSARWEGYRPRRDDIIIATYSKCGTTWMQRIVSMLLFQSAAPQPIWDLSPWFDMRLFGPIEAELAKAEALIAAGTMEPPGLAEVERAEHDGRWERAYDGGRTSEERER